MLDPILARGNYAAYSAANSSSSPDLVYAGICIGLFLVCYIFCKPK